MTTTFMRRSATPWPVVAYAALTTVAGALLPALAAAPPAPVPVTPAAASQAVMLTIPRGPAMESTERLAALRPETGPIQIRGARDEQTLDFNLSTRVEPQTARLHLEGTNSIALMARRSQLVISLNDVVVAQVALDPAAPTLVADIDLPLELLRGGNNRLGFAAAQHYTNDCEDDGAPELWTQIDTQRSSLSLVGAASMQTPHLSDLQDLLSPAMFGGRRFTLLTGAAPGQLRPELVQIGGDLAQALGLRLRYKPAEIAVAQAVATPRAAAPSQTEGTRATPQALRLAGTATQGAAERQPRDLVLFGTRDDIWPFLSEDVANQITGGFLALYPLPSDRRVLVTVVSGRTDVEVAQAARALAVTSVPFVDAPSQVITRIDVAPDSAPYPRNDLWEGAKARFADLGFPTATLLGRRSKMTLNLVMPPDLYAPDTAETELLLDFAYGAGLRSDSSVNVVLNGQFQQAISLNNQDGAVLRGYRIRIPLSKFRPGPNSVRFDVSLIPQGSGACMLRSTDNLVFTFHGTSSIELPAAEHMASQPDLHLFATTGFPYTGSAVPGSDPGDNWGNAMALASSDPSTLAAGFTVLSRLAQVSGRMLPDLQVIVGPPPSNRHILLVGAVRDIDPALLASLPVGLAPGTSFPYASATTTVETAQPWSSRVVSLFGLAAFAERSASQAANQASAIQGRPGVSRIHGIGDTGRNGVLMATRSSLTQDRTLTVLTTSTREALLTATEGLVQPTIWYQLANDVTLWKPQSDVVQTQRVSPVWHLGKPSTYYAIRYYVGEYPVTWVASVIVSALAFALAIRMVLVRRSRRIHPRATEGIP